MNDIPLLKRNQSSINLGLNTNVIKMLEDKKRGRGRPKKEHNDFNENEPIIRMNESQHKSPF